MADTEAPSTHRKKQNASLRNANKVGKDALTGGIPAQSHAVLNPPRDPMACVHVSLYLPLTYTY